MILIIIAIIFEILVLLFLFIFLPLLEKAHIERCERWKKEQIEAGMPEEFVDQMLLSDPDFIL